MVCKNCGNIIVKTDNHCRVCGEAVLPETIAKSIESQEVIEEKINSFIGGFTNVQVKRRYRSRWMLLLVFWIGGYIGLHYAWMGDADSAWAECKKIIKHFCLCFVLIGIPFLIIDMLIFCVNFFLIIFGKYSTDANGNPIVWFKFGKSEL